MKIVLLADQKKNELLQNFCLAYSTLLSKHELISLVHLSRIINAQTQLKIKGLPTDITAALDQLAAKAFYNEIDAVIYLKDADKDVYYEANPLDRACDMNMIPYATNLASAEILILAIDRGDLDWRELIV